MSNSLSAKWDQSVQLMLLARSGRERVAYLIWYDSGGKRCTSDALVSQGAVYLELNKISANEVSPERRRELAKQIERLHLQRYIPERVSA